MSNTVQVMSFVSAMRHFFGYRAGQTATGFAAELRTLSAEDRAWFFEALSDAGYNIIGSSG